MFFLRLFDVNFMGTKILPFNVVMGIKVNFKGRDEIDNVFEINNFA